MTSKPTVFLHVGHDKTGSSFLQASLALSAAALLEQGIIYPFHKSFEAAKRGEITSGNMTRSTDLLPFVEQAASAQEDVGRLLFSNEALFRRMQEDDLPRLAEVFDVTVILFLRDPLEYAISMYGQAVKRGGFSDDFSAFCTRHKPALNMPRRIMSFMEHAHQSACHLACVNYSRDKTALLSKFETILGVPSGTLIAPKAGRVNRSMTRAELYFLRQVNQILDRWGGQLVSDPLCNKLPDIMSEQPIIDPDFLADFDAYQHPILDQLNTLLPEGEAFDLSPSVTRYAGGEEEDTLTFSKEQIQVIAQSMSRQIAKASPVTAGDCDKLRQIARQGSGLPSEDVATLRQIADKLDIYDSLGPPQTQRPKAV